MDQFRRRFETGAGTGPAYRRLAGVLAVRIRSGELTGGTPLPPERNLAVDLGVSRVTVRAAYRSLVEEGLVEVRAGSGNYVRQLTKSFEQPLWRLSSFSDDMAERGAPASNRVLSLIEGQALPREAALLEIAERAPVFRLRRLRIGGERPLAVETAVLSRARTAPRRGFTLTALDVGQGSLYAFLAARGLAPVRAVQRMRAVELPDEEANLLQVQPGSAGMFTERVAFLGDGKPIEYTFSHYRGDAYEFVAQMNTLEDRP